MKKTTETASAHPHHEPHPSLAAILAEIARVDGEQRRLMNEEAQLFASRKEAPPEAPLTDAQLVAEEHFRRQMNGTLAPNVPILSKLNREATISAVRAGNAKYLLVLRQRETDARIREGEAWAREIDPTWRKLCREITLTAVKLFALEDRARQILENEPSRGYPGDLAMTLHINTSCSLLGIGEPLRPMVEAALAEGIVTKAEIKGAQHV